MAAGGVSTAGASTAVDFTPAGFTAASRACTTALTVAAGGTGTMAGTADATAGGWPVPDWRGRIMIIRGGALIRIMAITTTASLTPARLGTIAPIRRAI